ncbi:hypothetical protein [Ferrimonas senticii]|uniref:hypothetical protein n=1 Tax=Ferrimonas senticii TaxID=394566 RepID=UPI00042895DE|nr:hypothetical protein [Ferrimonas senticii]
MLLQLMIFLAASLIIGLAPIYVGARVLRTGNPSVIGAVIALAAVLALQDMAFRFIEETQLAWLASVFAGAFAISLMVDCPYWKALLISGLIILIQMLATDALLGGTPAPEHLGELISGTQKELWPDYH